ncbi:MAG: arginine repressor [Lachnospiraceae bacterium]|nr:arginine repressor [Lachnospiraceae bacterium]
MKNARQEQILKLIHEQEIGTQEELAELLNACGFQVTQATVSRDIRQLELAKVPGTNGRMRYSNRPEDSRELNYKYRRVLMDAYVSIEVSLNLAVMHVVSGMANAAAAALDMFDWPEVLGTIAGDDTILLILRSPDDAQAMLDRISDIVEK